MNSFFTKTSPSFNSGTGISSLYCSTSVPPVFSIQTPFIVFGNCVVIVLAKCIRGVLERCTVIAERRVRALVEDVASREGRKRDRATGVIQLEGGVYICMYVYM